MSPAMELVRLFLPLIWTAVAIVVAIVLHRTTKAKLQTKWLLAGGSLVIFAASFWLMMYATPRLLRQGVNETALNGARDWLDRGNAQVEIAFQTCVDSTKNEQRCVDDLNTLRSTLKRANREIDAVLHPAD